MSRHDQGHIPAELMASAIAQTLHVFEGEQAVEQVLDYLKAVLNSASRVPPPAEGELRAAMLKTAAEVAATRAENKTLSERCSALQDENWRLGDQISEKDRAIIALEKQVLTLFGPAAAPAPADAAAAEAAVALAEQEGRRADSTRAAYDRIRAAHLVLARDYDKLEAANADLAAQLAAVHAASAHGGATASIAEEAHTAAGAAPVAGAEKAGLLDGANQPQTRMDAGAGPATSGSCLMVEVGISQIDAALVKWRAAQDRAAARAATVAAMAKDAS